MVFLVADPTTPVTQNSTCSNVPGGDQFAVRPSLVADSYTVSIHFYLNKNNGMADVTISNVKCQIGQNIDFTASLPSKGEKKRSCSLSAV